MVRLITKLAPGAIKFAQSALLLGLLTWLTLPSVAAQSATVTPQTTVSPQTTVTPQTTVSPTPTPAATLTPTATLESAQGATAAVTNTQTLLPTATPTPAAALQSAGGTTAAVIAQSSSGPLAGTIIANRSQATARFFAEGQTYVVAPGLAQGLDLPRPSTVVNLFNCAADAVDDGTQCFWDPYLVQRDGLYEVYDSPVVGDQLALLLRQVGSPPSDQVWLQNRTSQPETVVFRGEAYEIPPTTVVEFPVATGVPAILYVRSCLTLGGQSVCEWAPKSLDAGNYYAMTEVSTPSAQSGSIVTTIDVRPVLLNESTAAAATTTAQTTAPATTAPTTTGLTTAAPTVQCRVLVPALNVRSGPGLQYAIVSKVRATGSEPPIVPVIARSPDNQWLVVSPSLTADGWINNNPSFIACLEDIASLPIVEPPAPPPTPTPLPMTEVPVIIAPPVADQPPATELPATELPATEQPITEQPVTPVDPAPAPTTTEMPTPEPTAPSGPTIPPGQSLLLVNNSFMHDMRITIDQRYRPQDGPSEYDLSPGSAIAIVVYPGQVSFTASSPWNGLSSNTTLELVTDQSLTLWMRFELDPGGSWVFRWE